jgi:hypothetical protein
MDIGTYVTRLRAEVSSATALGGPQTVEAAERMLLALDPAVRLTLLEALSDAAAEITSELPDGSVEVRLHGRDVELVVDAGAPAGRAPWVAPADTGTDTGGGDLVRLTLRLPPDLKTQAEAAATQSGQSLNSWLVGAVRAATLPGGASAGPVPPQRPSLPGKHVTGWA